MVVVQLFCGVVCVGLSCDELYELYVSCLRLRFITAKQRQVAMSNR